jgi:hypothetical protein
MRELAGLMLHGALFSAALGSLLAVSSLSSSAQQPANKQSPGPASPPISAATGETIAAEGELRETIRTYQSGNPSAVYRYYWWRDGCYVRDGSNNYQSAPSESCHQQH